MSNHEHNTRKRKATSIPQTYNGKQQRRVPSIPQLVVAAPRRRATGRVAAIPNVAPAPVPDNEEDEDEYKASDPIPSITTMHMNVCAATAATVPLALPSPLPPVDPPASASEGEEEKKECVQAEGTVHMTAARIEVSEFHRAIEELNTCKRLYYLLSEARWNEVFEIIMMGRVSHREHYALSQRYHAVYEEGKPILRMEVDANTVRQMSGRHAKNKKRQIQLQQQINPGEQQQQQQQPIEHNSSTDSSDSEGESAQDYTPSITTASAQFAVCALGAPRPRSVEPVKKRIPKISEIEGILTALHETSHFGIVRLYKKVCQHFLGISREMCTLFIKKCTVCSSNRISSKPQPVIVALHSTRPGQVMQMDCMTFTDKRTGVAIQRVCLHVQDHFTKWSEIILIPNKEAETVALALWRIFMRIGCPQRVQTDNGSEFRNSVMVAFLARVQTATGVSVSFIHSRPYHPESQGSVERANGVLRCALEILCSMSPLTHTPFPDLLLMVQWNMNTAFHRAIGRSSYEVIYGRLPPADLGIPFLQLGSLIATEEALGIGAYADELSHGTRGALLAQKKHAEIEEATLHAALTYKANFLAQMNRNRVDIIYSVGELVWLRVARHNSSGIEVKFPNILAIILRTQPTQNCYQIYTTFGMVAEFLHASLFAKSPTGLDRPEELSPSADSILAKLLVDQTKAISMEDLCNLIRPKATEKNDSTTRQLAAKFKLKNDKLALTIHRKK